jgi:hypothetical protein
VRGGHLGAQQVGGDLQVDRAVWGGGRVTQGAGRRGRDLAGGERAVGRFHDRREHRRLIGRLVQDAAVGVRLPQGGGDVGGDHQHGRSRRPRLAHRAERVRGARPGRGDRDSELPGRPRIAVGRVGGGLLVPDPDQPDARVAQRLPQRQVVHAGQPEAQLDAALLEQIDDETRAGGHGAHPFSAGDLRDGWRSGAAPSRSGGAPAGCGRSGRRRSSSGGRGAIGRSA